LVIFIKFIEAGQGFIIKIDTEIMLIIIIKHFLINNFNFYKKMMQFGHFH